MPDDPRPRRPLRAVIATNPEARRRVRKAYADLLAVVLAAVAGLSALVVWHLVRRGRVLREGLAPPRAVRLPDVDPAPTDPDRPEP